jgi:hypothetical protein
MLLQSPPKSEILVEGARQLSGLQQNELLAFFMFAAAGLAYFISKKFFEEKKAKEDDIKELNQKIHSLEREHFNSMQSEKNNQMEEILATTQKQTDIMLETTQKQAEIMLQTIESSKGILKEIHLQNGNIEKMSESLNRTNQLLARLYSNGE